MSKIGYHFIKLGIISSDDLQIIFSQAFDLIKEKWAAVKAQGRQIQNWGVKLPGGPIKVETQVCSVLISAQFSSWLLVSSPVSQNKGPLPPVLEYIMDNSTVAWFLTRFLTRLCAHNCFPPELLRVFPSGRIRKYSFECPVSKRSSVFCLWVGWFLFLCETCLTWREVKSEEVQMAHMAGCQGNLGKNWDLTKEKLGPRSGLTWCHHIRALGVLLTF